MPETDAIIHKNNAQNTLNSNVKSNGWKLS